MDAVALRPRSFTEIIDAAFALLRERYVTLVTAGAVILFPMILFDLFLPDSLALVSRLVGNVLFTIFDAAVILIISDAYLGREADVGQVLRSVLDHGGRLFGASIYRGILVLLGTMLLIVPGMIVYAWTFAMPMMIVLEGASGASQAFAKSRELVRGDVPRVLGIMFVSVVVMMMLMLAVAAVTGMVVGAVGIEGRISNVMSTLVAILVYPLASVVGTLLYYDLRIRKQGFDLEMMAREMDAPQAAPAATVG